MLVLAVFFGGELVIFLLLAGLAMRPSNGAALVVDDEGLRRGFSRYFARGFLMICAAALSVERPTGATPFGFEYDII